MKLDVSFIHTDKKLCVLLFSNVCKVEEHDTIEKCIVVTESKNGVTKKPVVILDVVSYKSDFKE